MERTRQAAQEVYRLRQTITDEQISLARKLMAQITAKWALRVLYTLALSGEPLRFLTIAEKVDGISEKVLAQTLRSLERGGMIVRTSFYSKVPPRVEYELTQLGRDLVLTTCPLWKWMLSSIPHFESASQAFTAARGRALMVIVYTMLLGDGPIEWVALG